MMSIEELDDWDSTFLEQAIHAEKEIISFSSSLRNPTHPTSPSSSSNFSPPRELSLSQNPRPPPPINFNYVALPSTATSRQEETRVNRLQMELQSVAQHLIHLEKQYEELKKENAKKEEQLRSLTFNNVHDHHHHPHHHTHNADTEQVTVLQDRLPLFQNASSSTPQDGSDFPVFEAKNNRKTSCARETLDRLSSDCINVLDKGKNVKIEGISVTADLKQRILIDSDLTTSNECSIQKIVLPETTAQSKCTKAVGVQTDIDGGRGFLSANNYVDPHHDLLNKFSAIWGLENSRRAGRSLVSKLFVMCAADFYALFRCLGMSMPSTLESLVDLSIADVVVNDKLQHVQPAEAAKVAHLYFLLAKINNEMVQLDVLIDALIDLCTLDNVVVVHRSLHIVHVVLQHVLDWDARSDRRDNVVIEGMYPKNSNLEICKPGKVHTGVQFGVRKNGTSFLGNDSSSIRSFDLDILCKEEHGDPGNMAFVSALDCLPLFETIHRIAVGNKEECIQVEALSVMNLILMRSNPCLEREKFGSRLLFESLSRLLQKDAGLQVQKQAVHLLFLLLNCPKILVSFCSGCKDGMSFGAAANPAKDELTFRGFNTILEGLAECVKCRGHSAQELKLRRLSVKVLAFVASSGKSGFEVFLNPKLSKSGNFLELIMQALASEMDTEAAESTEPSETCRERTSLIREALILLNRLASSPAYSGSVLQVLASSRDRVSLTVDVVSGMSRKGTDLWKSDGIKKRKAEDEILDLARVLRSRVFAYLGNNSS